MAIDSRCCCSAGEEICSESNSSEEPSVPTEAVGDCREVWLEGSGRGWNEVDLLMEEAVGFRDCWGEVDLSIEEGGREDGKGSEMGRSRSMSTNSGVDEEE